MQDRKIPTEYVRAPFGLNPRPSTHALKMKVMSKRERESDTRTFKVRNEQ